MTQPTKGPDIENDLDLDIDDILNDVAETENESHHSINKNEASSVEGLGLRIVRNNRQDSKQTVADQKIDDLDPAHKINTTGMADKNKQETDNEKLSLEQQTKADADKSLFGEFSPDRTCAIKFGQHFTPSDHVEDPEQSPQYDEITIHSKYFFNEKVDHVDQKQRLDKAEKLKTGNAFSTNFVDVKGAVPDNKKKKSNSRLGYFILTISFALLLILFLVSGYDKFKFSEIKQSIVESPVVNESPAPVEALKIFKSEEAEATLKSNLASLKNRLAQAVLFVNESEVSVMESTEQPVTELEVTELETSELETTESEMAVLVEPELEVYSSNNSNLTEHVKIKYVWALNLPSVSNERDESYAELERIQKAGIPAEIYEIEINQVLWFRIRIKGFDTEQNAIKYMEKVKRQTGISRYWTNLIQTKAP